MSKMLNFVAPDPLPQRFLKLDEDGYWLIEQNRIEDIQSSQELFTKLCMEPGRGRLFTSWQGQWAIVESFDAPLVVHSISHKNNNIYLKMPLGYTAIAEVSAFSLDEWDRVHGYTQEGLPFVLSRQAQVELFNAAESYDDESISVYGRHIPTPSWLHDRPQINQADFWSEIYRQEAQGWELGKEAEALPSLMAQLKLSRAKIMVLGCGSGHDAAYLARQGHIVTAVDISPEAITWAQNQYGHLPNLSFVMTDAFVPKPEWVGQFDLVFEHTCYCAINPSRRNSLVKVWRSLLKDSGYLLGIFFVTEKTQGPPFGGSEWEVRQRLHPHFNFLYWTRWRHSIPRRQGAELVIYAQKKMGPL